MKFLTLTFLLLFLSASCGAQTNMSGGNSSSMMSSQEISKTQDLIVGNLLKNSLENIHLVKKKVDDDLSEKAFNEYLQKLDYGKQFLTAPDVKDLKKFSKSMDDELISAQFDLIDQANVILQKRYKEVKGFVAEITKNPFDFTKDETLESDAKKRNYSASSTELKELWTKILKYETLTRLSELKEDRDNQIKGKKDDKKDKKKKYKKVSTEDLKKKSDAELEQMARMEVGENYSKILGRLDKEDATDRKEKFYNSITRIFDPHTDYLIPDVKADFDIDMSGKLEGIGALLREDGSNIKVQEIIVGSASWKKKELEAEDTILKVAQGKAEPVSIVGMPLRDAVKLIRGKKGTEVRLTVKKPSGLTKELSIIRDTVEIEESYVKSAVFNTGDGHKYGYIMLPKFYRDFQSRTPRNCTDDMKIELKKLNNENVEGLIFDLRNNGGGSLEDARMISGLFINKGPVVQIKESGGRTNVMEDTDSEIVFKKPVVVLINAYSASASEIVAGALQDYKRAIVIGGSHSHGKGSVQTVIDLKNFLQSPNAAKMDLGALKITVQKFYRVNGISTQFNGITPDVVLPDPLDVLESGEKYLDYAVTSDSIAPSNYVLWDGPRYDLKKMKEGSEKRVKSSSRFSAIQVRMNLAKEKKDKTLKSLKQVDFDREMAEVKKVYDDDKDLPEIKGLKVKSLATGTQKLNKEKIKDYEDSLKKDAYLEESFFILSEMTKA
ncbi:MAG: carboxy terminal-processing peptidase [Bacteriovoracaceae bacterium]